MKQLQRHFFTCLTYCFAFATVQSQTSLPYLPMSDNFGGQSVDTTLFVANSGDYTLEVTGHAGTAIKIGFVGITYTPEADGLVRFAQKDNSVYIFENNAFKIRVTPNPSYTIEGDNIIQNPGFESGVLFDGSTNRWKPDSWATWNGGTETWGSDVGYTNVRQDAAYVSEGTKSIIMHSNTRYLTQALPPTAIQPISYYKLTYDYWTSSGTGNGGNTYQVMLGTDLASDNLLTLTGHTTEETGTEKKSFSLIFQTPAAVPASLWFSLYRNKDGVDWLDNLKLVQVIPTHTGISGVTTAVYLQGKAYAPEALVLSAGDYMDMTNHLANPGFENDLNGWTTVNGAKISTVEKANGLIEGTQKHAQIWVGSGGVTGEFYQEVNSLPNGKYSLQAAISPSFSGTLQLFANDGKTSITSGSAKIHLTTGMVYDHSLRIGLRLNVTGSPTIDFDEFTLQYQGMDVDGYLNVLKTKLSEAIADTLSMHVNAGLPGFTNLPQYRQVIESATTLPDSLSNTLINAINELMAAIAEYEAIQLAYEPLKTAISTLASSVNASGYTGDKTPFEAAIYTANVAYDSPLDQRRLIPSIVQNLEALTIRLSHFVNLRKAITSANNLLTGTDYSGKEIFEASIATAQEIYDAPDGIDLYTAYIALLKAKTTYYNSQYTIPAQRKTVSWVDHTLNGSEKFVLRVDGIPFYPTNVQVRLDKLYGYNGWSDAAMEAVVKRAAEDRFNTLSIPLHWREVEPEKDYFDWSILDKYLNWCKKYNIKMELLWFSWSSGGRVQYLVDYNGTQTLRTPDYVCSMDGTSEFKMLRTQWEYSLDWRDTNLRDRETYVLRQIMNHIALWEANNGNPKTVIGVQLGNEARTHGNNTASAAEIINYYHHVGSGVKASDHVTWTRLNCVSYETSGRISANENQRNNGGTNIDFVGVDIYGIDAGAVKGDMWGYLPATGKNYRMIMEIDAKNAATPLYQMAALAGNKAFDYYNFAVVDGNNLYTNSGTTLVERSHINLVRQRNTILNLANQAIALKAHGMSLYVYNYAGNSTSTETGISNIKFSPNASNTQAIALRNTATEYILLSTSTGLFTFPATSAIIAVSKGYYDNQNNWIDEGSITFNGNVVVMPATSAVKVQLGDPATTIPSTVNREELSISVIKGGILITRLSNQPSAQQTKIHTLTGQLIRSVTPTSQGVFVPLSKGLYLVDKKIIIIT